MTNRQLMIRPDLNAFDGYVSARECGSSIGVCLNANELPWGEWNRYPNQQPPEMQALLADYYGVETNQLLITRGSGEGIDTLVRLCCSAYRSSLVVLEPTFGLYRVAAQLQGVVVRAAAFEGAQTDVVAEVLRCVVPDTALVFLCSPNNPTGTVLSLSEIERLCLALQEQCMVVIDEAYIEFSDQRSASCLMDVLTNLVILRTCSKALGLAAVRVGSMIANAAFIRAARQVLAPYPLSGPSIDIVCEQLRPAGRVCLDRQLKRIVTERQVLEKKLNALDVIGRVWPSQANFLLVESEYDLVSACAESGIVIRDMSQVMGRSFCARISVGSANENDALVNRIRSLK